MTSNTPTPQSDPNTAVSPSFGGEDAAAPTPKAKKKGAARFVTPALALVAAVGIGLFGGVLIGQNAASATTAAGPGGGATGQRSDGATGDAAPGTAGGGMGGFTSGTVSAIDGDTITLTLTDGSTVTVTATDDTTVTTTDDAAVSDLAEGDSLTVVGEADDDGNVAATSISEGATGFGGGGGGGGFGGGTPPTGSGADE